MGFIAKSENRKIAAYKANAVALGITSGLGTLFALSICLPYLNLQYFSLVVYMTVVSFVYAGNCNFLALLFPEEHFGRLLGITELIAALLLTLQYPLSIFVLRFCHGNFLPINITFVVLCLLTLIHPLILFNIDIRSLSVTPEQLGTKSEKD